MSRSKTPQHRTIWFFGYLGYAHLLVFSLPYLKHYHLKISSINENGILYSNRKTVIYFLGKTSKGFRTHFNNYNLTKNIIGHSQLIM